MIASINCCRFFFPSSLSKSHNYPFTSFSQKPLAFPPRVGQFSGCYLNLCSPNYDSLIWNTYWSTSHRGSYFWGLTLYNDIFTFFLLKPFLIMFNYMIWSDNYLIFHHENRSYEIETFLSFLTKTMNILMSAFFSFFSTIYLFNDQSVPPGELNSLTLSRIYTFIILSWTFIKHPILLKTTYFNRERCKINALL